MKKTILTTLVTGAMAASVFAQGTVSFKGGTAIAFKFSTDSVTALTPAKDTSVSPTGAATTGTFGDITVDIFSAVTGTSLAGDNTASLLIAALTAPGTPWALASGTPSSAGYLGSGVFNTATVTLNNIAPGNNAELEVVAFTGSLTDPGLIGFSGEMFNGSQEGALGFVQGTGGVGTPPSLATGLVTGANGFDGITLQSVPEPTTMALGGLGAAALLMFRRRK